MSITKLPLKKVTYLRAHDNDKNHAVILGGDSRWMRDIELLLEDEWKNVYCPEDFSAFGKTLGEHPPRICVVELGAYQNSESKLLDLNLPKGTEKLLVAHSLKDTVSWKRTQRLMASRGVKCIELSEDSKIASQELAEVFTGLCSAGFSLSEDLQLIQNAFQGYRIGEGSEESEFLKLFKALAAKFVFDPNDIVAGTLFAETYSLWKQPKSTNSSLQFAYMNAESSVRDENIFKLIEFSKKCLDLFEFNGILDEATFQELATNSSFGRLTIRMIKTSFPEVASCLSKNQSGLRLVKAA